jgi:polyhydroxyalkanoate synthesis regulator phasin
MVLDTTRDVVHKSLLAMLGAITLADDELEQLLDRLAARGEQVTRDQLNHVEAVRNRLMGNQSVTREVGHEGRVLQQTLQEEIERRGRLFAAALDLPTRDSINLLREQVDQIGRALDQILAARVPLAAPTGDGHAPVESAVAASEAPETAEESVAIVPEAPVESAVAAPIEAETEAESEAPATVEESGEAAPVPGYDALNAKQAAALVGDLDEATLLALREYEQAHRNRVTVLRAIELALAQRDTPSA